MLTIRPLTRHRALVRMAAGPRGHGLCGATRNSPDAPRDHLLENVKEKTANICSTRILRLNNIKQFIKYCYIDGIK